MKTLTKEEFISRAKEKHGDKFDYTKVEYVNKKTKIKIICPKHGEFLQEPLCHLRNMFCCHKCIPNRKNLTHDSFIEECDKIHNKTYDYSKTKFTKLMGKIIIICKKHGEFEQRADSHMNGGGCWDCKGTAPRDTKSYIEKAKLIHGDKYDYSNLIYVCDRQKIKIICKIHGEFEQRPSAHLAKAGCSQCANRATGKSSKPENEWLDYLNIPERCRNLTIKANGKNYNVDGYVGEGNLVYEFLGDFWHGNPSVFKASDINCSNKRTFGNLFEKTVNKIRALRSHGFKVICIWEKDFKRKFKNEKTCYSRKSKQK